MKKLSFSKRIIIGFTAIFAIMLFTAIFSIIRLINLNDNMELVYEHPFKVSKSIRNIQIEIYKDARLLRDITFVTTPEQLDSLRVEVDVCEKNIDIDFKVLYERFLGNKKDIDSVYNDFAAWKVIKNKMYRLKAENKIDSLHWMSQYENHKHVDKLIAHSKAISDFASNKADTIIKQTIEKQHQSLMVLVLILVLASLATLLFSYFISRSISKPIKKFINQANSIFSVQSSKTDINFKHEEDLFNHTIQELTQAYQNIAQQNEEINSFNEELKSSYEEIECSNEEIKSINDQLTQLNSTLEQKVEERTQQIKESEKFLRETQLIANLGTYTLDITSGKWVSSEILNAIFGIDADYDKSVAGWAGVIHPEWQKLMTDYFAQEVIGNKTEFNKEYKIVRKNDNATRWVHGLGRLSFDENNQPIRMVGAIQDITERKQLEEALQENEIKFKTVADHTYDWEYWEGTDSQLIYISPSCQRISGYIPEEFMLDNSLLKKIVHPDDVKLFEIHSLKAHSVTHKHQVEEIDFRIIKKDKSTANIGHLCTPVFDENGNYLGRRISNRDITARKQATEKLLLKNQELAASEEELRAANEELSATSDALKISNEVLFKEKEKVEEREKRLNEAQQIAHIGNWDLNLVTNELLWSDEIYRIFEIDPAKFGATYEAFLNAIHPDDRDSVNKAFTTSLETHTNYEITHRLLMPDGRVKFVIEFCETFYDKMGQPIRSVGIVQDITDRIKAEEKLKESEEKFRLLFENASDGIILLNLNKEITTVNESFAQMHGYSIQEMKNMSINDLDTPETNKHSEKRIQRMLNGESLKFEVKHFHKQGNILTLEVSTSIIKIGNEKYILAFHRDITERKQNEELLRELAIAENTNKIKDQFLANMSHEIRTPLSGIIGMTEILSSTTLDEAQKDYVTTIRDSSDNLLTIINDVLDIAKIEGGKMELHPTVIEMDKFQHKFQGTFTGLLKGKQLKLVVALSDQLPKQLLADEKRIAQIINNLLSNAVKFTKEGTVKINFSIIETISSDKAKYKVEVTDTGIGIKQVDKEKLFSKFTQIDSSMSRSQAGTGLGLVICKELVQLMHGEIGVYSEEGKGSTFWFTFEAKTVKELTETAKKVETVPERTLRANILVVDDLNTNRKIAAIMLKKLGCEVALAENGMVALEIFEEGRFDIILMDIQMPIMDGVETTKKLKAKHKKTPIIIGLSANAMEGDAEKYIEQGMDDYITKPLTIDKLRTVIEKWIKT